MQLIDFYKDVFSVTDIGMVRQANEDNCYAGETPNGFLFIVCDGMGGHVGGARASAIAVNSIVKFFTKEYYAVVHQALADALLFANRQILGAAAAVPELKGMGTTACVLLLRDGKAWFAHIGDSRIYLYYNKQQQLHRLTKDHSVVQEMVDQDVISEAEAEHHPHKNRLLKTLGVKKEIQPEVCLMPVLPAKGDIFLICSDGLTGMVKDNILRQILEPKTALQEKGKYMLTQANQAGGTDNITLQLIHISNSPHKESVFDSKGTVNNHKKSSKQNMMLAAALVLLSVVLAVTLLQLNSKTKEDVQNNQQKVESLQKKEWEKRISELGLNDELVIDGRKVFVKNKEIFGEPVDAVIVDPNGDSYRERKIILHKINGTIRFTLF